MRRSILVVLVLVLVVTACGGGDLVAGTPATTGEGSTGPAGPDQTSSPELPSDTAQIMAAALQRLVDDEGGVPDSATTFLVRRAIDRYAGVTGGDGDDEDTVDPAGGCCGRPLTDEELAAIEAALAPAGEVRFIDDPADWAADTGVPIQSGTVILGVGEPEIDGDTALVPVSMWCGGLCGTYLSYRLDLTPGGWRVVGPEGPIGVA